MGQNATDRSGLPLDERSQQIFEHLEQSGALPPWVGAVETVSAVLFVLSRRLRGSAARDLVAAAPPALQAMLQPYLMDRDERPDVFSRRELLKTVAEHLRLSPSEAEPVARAVFTAVQAAMPVDEVADIQRQLPPDLRDLWGVQPESAPVSGSRRKVKARPKHP